MFAGGFDLEAAHGVLGADADTDDDTLDSLTGLLDKSMVKMRAGAAHSPATSYSKRCAPTGVIDCGRTDFSTKTFCDTPHYYTELAERAVDGDA